MSEMYIRDIGTEIYQLIVNDKQLKKVVPSGHVFQYHVPEELQEKTPIVRITKINMLPNNYEDDRQMAFDYKIQIDVRNKGRLLNMSKNINRIMKEFTST